MNKLLLPTILAATVLVAGIFALTQIEEATTVHTTIQNTQMVMDAVEVVDVAIADAGTDVYTLNCAGEFELMSLNAAFAGTDSNNEEFGIIALGGDNLVVAQADGALSVGANALITESTAGGAADDLTLGPTAGTYTDNTLVIKASLLRQSDQTCIFTETG